jgi:hypothetical protein
MAGLPLPRNARQIDPEQFGTPFPQFRPQPIIFAIRSKFNVIKSLRRKPQPAHILLISGITKDSAGAILGSCVVTLYQTVGDKMMEKVTSDATTGAYSFSAVGLSETYYVVAYKAGVPDVAGTTINSLIGI